MKKLLLISTIICLTHFSFAQTIPLDSAFKYIGKTVTICSKVVGTFVTNGEHKATYLDFGQPFPNQTFRVVIFEQYLVNFKYNPAEFLKDKTICITGKVEMYKEKPQIKVKKEEQIKIE